jgi:ribulose-phosphate 3-epimerase
MAAVIPAILPTSRKDLDDHLLRLHGVTDRVQIDVVDGRFVAPASWPYAQHEDVQKLVEESLPELGSFRFEIDLMVEEPEKAIGSWIRAGATRITVHAETTRNLTALIQNFQVTYGHDKDFAPGLIAFGLAINLATDTSLIEPYLDQCDYVQFMGIARIGKQGEPFAPEVIQKIHDFHRKHPDMPIQVDGGVSRANAQRLVEAGTSRLVVGSDLWNAPDLAAELKELCHIAETRGLFA